MNAQESPLPQEPSPSPNSVSPDKKWEYKCVEYGLGQCAPEILKAAATEVMLDLDDDVNGPDAKDATVIWAPNSKRFAFNYSPPHAHHTRYVTVAFYQLVNDKWVQLPSPVEATEQSQLAELAKEHLLKGFNPRRCTPDWDVLKLRSWIDDNSAILYAPCRARQSGTIGTAFLFTVKFDSDGKSKIVKTKRLSGKKLTRNERLFRFVVSFSNMQETPTKETT
jgi:hypothetical protein